MRPSPGQHGQPDEPPGKPGTAAENPSGPPMVGKGLRPNPGLKPSLAKRLQAGLAELLLVNRLRSLASRHQAADILKRAAAVVWLTCKSWFGTGEADKTRPPGPKR